MRGVKTPLPTINDVIDQTIKLGSLTNKNIKCIGISLNTSAMTEGIKSLKYKIENEFKLPCLDPLIDDLTPFVNQIK